MIMDILFIYIFLKIINIFFRNNKIQNIYILKNIIIIILLLIINYFFYKIKNIILYC